MRRAVVVAVMLLAPGFASAAQERSTAVVPDLANTSLDRAVVRLHRLGLRVGTTTPYYLASNSVPLVGGESPPAGTTAPAGAVVTLKVLQPPTVSPRATDVPERVPSVTGRTLAAAVKRIEGAGLLFWTVNKVPALRRSAAPTLWSAYRVTGQRPRAGTILQQRRQSGGVERIYAVKLSVRRR